MSIEGEQAIKMQSVLYHQVVAERSLNKVIRVRLVIEQLGLGRLGGVVTDLYTIFSRAEHRREIQAIDTLLKDLSTEE